MTSNLVVNRLESYRQEVSRWLSRRGWWREQVHNREETNEMLRAVSEDMETARYPAPDILGMRLTLERVVTNALKPAGPAGRVGAVHVSFHVNAERVLAEVEGPLCDRDLAQLLDPEMAAGPAWAGADLAGPQAPHAWLHYTSRQNKCLMLCKSRSNP